MSKYRDIDGRNETRADSAQDTLIHFAEVSDARGEPLNDLMGDLVVNLMHLAYREDIDFRELLARSMRRYEEETNLSLTFEVRDVAGDPTYAGDLAESLRALADAVDCDIFTDAEEYEDRVTHARDCTAGAKYLLNVIPVHPPIKG